MDKTKRRDGGEKEEKERGRSKAKDSFLLLDLDHQPSHSTLEIAFK